MQNRGMTFKARKIKDMTTEDKGKLFGTIRSFRSFIYSLPTQQDCVHPVGKREKEDFARSLRCSIYPSDGKIEQLVVFYFKVL